MEPGGVVTWATGAEKVRELIDQGELEEVEPSVEIARRLLADAEQHVTSARTIADTGDLTGAYQLAYDALRKAGASLLAVQGLRATTRGGHIAVQHAVIAQFGNGISEFRSFSRIRRNRNRFEYPGDSASEPTEDDLNDALQIASEVAGKVATIFERGVLGSWRA